MTKQTPKWNGYPLSIGFILGNEFCERFSFYGMKAILVIYLTQKLYIDDDDATTIYHAFNMLCYFTPIFGAIIADSWWGKFRTIFIISILYAAGNIFMSVSSILLSLWMGVVALVVIGFGTGGIKPCVSAFGGDQFDPEAERQRDRFFFIFYFSINAGSLLSIFITPILREDISCTNDGDCYPLAFGVPAALMLIALVFFIIGSPFYIKLKPSGNMIVKVIQAARTKSAERNNEQNQLLKDLKSVWRVLVLFLPIPVVWALFDQQGSRWTLQATNMDGTVGGWTIKPDQIQVFNPFLILFFIPVFDYFIFPCLDKLRIPNRPLQRMAAGMLMVAGSFVIAGFLQLAVNETLYKHPGGTNSAAKFVNIAPCDVKLDASWGDPNQKFTQTIAKGQASRLINTSKVENLLFDIEPKAPCSGLVQQKALKLEHGNGTLAVITADHIMAVNPSTIISTNLFLKKPYKGRAVVRTVFNAPELQPDVNNYTIIFTEFGVSSDPKVYEMNAFKNDSVPFSPYYEEMEPLKYNVKLVTNGKEEDAIGDVIFEQGAVYVIGIVRKDHKDPNGKYKIYRNVEVPPNTVSMLLQIPQYVLLTMGEVLFSPVGLAFAFSQSPESMRSILQSVWLMTVAFGNLIVIIVAQASFFTLEIELFFFAGLMVAAVFVFTLLSLWYKNVDIASPGEITTDNKDDYELPPYSVDDDRL